MLNEGRPLGNTLHTSLSTNQIPVAQYVIGYYKRDHCSTKSSFLLASANQTEEAEYPSISVENWCHRTIATLKVSTTNIASAWILLFMYNGARSQAY